MKELLRWIFSDAFSQKIFFLISKRFWPHDRPTPGQTSPPVLIWFTNYLVQYYTWKQKWVPLSSETRRTPESAPIRHHEFHLRSIWLNIPLKLFDQHININHTTLMKQSLKFSSLEDLSFPPKCAPQSALLTELLKQPLLNILLNQIRSFLSLFSNCSNI